MKYYKLLLAIIFLSSCSMPYPMPYPYAIYNNPNPPTLYSTGPTFTIFCKMKPEKDPIGAIEWNCHIDKYNTLKRGKDGWKEVQAIQYYYVRSRKDWLSDRYMDYYQDHDLQYGITLNHKKKVDTVYIIRTIFLNKK